MIYINRSIRVYVGISIMIYINRFIRVYVGYLL